MCEEKGFISSLVGGILCVVLLVGTLTLVLSALFGKDTGNWENVVGTVFDADSHTRSRMTMVGKVPVYQSYTVYIIDYQFDVDGITYGGHEELRKSYDIGDFIDIKYNPDNPTENTVVY